MYSLHTVASFVIVVVLRVTYDQNLAKSSSRKMKEMSTSSGMDQVSDPDNDCGRKSPLSHLKFLNIVGSQNHLVVRYSFAAYASLPTITG